MGAERQAVGNMQRDQVARRRRACDEVDRQTPFIKESQILGQEFDDFGAPIDREKIALAVEQRGPVGHPPASTRSRPARGSTVGGSLPAPASASSTDGAQAQ